MFFLSNTPLEDRLYILHSDRLFLNNSIAFSFRVIPDIPHIIRFLLNLASLRMLPMHQNFEDLSQQGDRY